MPGYVRVALLTNEAGVDGVELALGDRECELLAFLALSGGFAEAESLAVAMWPHADPARRNRDLWIALKNLREALPNRAMLRSECGGYRLDAAIAVDLWEIEAYLRGRRRSPKSRCSIDELLYRRLVRYTIKERFQLESWAWARSLRVQIDGLRKEIGTFLGYGLLAERRVYAAYRVAQDLRRAFPSYAPARSLLEEVERSLTGSYLLALPKAG